jgi:hypothetical protein
MSTVRTRTTPAMAAALAIALMAALAASSAVAQQASFEQLVIVTVPVLGNDNVPEAERYLVCVPQTRFMRNQKISWLIKVLDPRTGEYLDNQALGQVEVRLASGEVLEARYGPRPRDDPRDFYWATGWTITEDYPAGTLAYTVTAEALDGRTGHLVHFDTPSTFIVILDEAVAILLPN